MTNECTHVPSEVRTPRRNPRPIHPHLSKVRSYLEKIGRTGSPLLTRALANIRKGFLTPTKRKSERNILTNTTTEPTHKI